ncbi:MAG TPA: MFS transporter [candidate division Zixibacteria bacterium]
MLHYLRGMRSDAHRRDLAFLYVAAFLRSTAVGLGAVILGLLLVAQDLQSTQIGAVITAGLAGNACAALLITLRGSRDGLKRRLVALSLLSAAGGVAITVAVSLPLTLLAAFVGMLNGMGRDRGPLLILDQAILPSAIDDRQRTKAFAWYNVIQDTGHALGALLAAGCGTLVGTAALSQSGVYRLGMLVYAALMVLTALAYAALTRMAESPRTATLQAITPETKRIVVRLSLLFGLDGLASGFVTTAALTAFFMHHFEVAPETIGALFFAARVANVISHLAAARIARRFGLVNTMVWTHIPSSVLLATVPFASSFALAAILFLIRESLVEMDVPTRQSYVMAMVGPDERVFASGVTGLVRLAAWAISPVIGGIVAEGLAAFTPFAACAGAKILYDLLLYRSFGRLKPPEEIRPVS